MRFGDLIGDLGLLIARSPLAVALAFAVSAVTSAAGEVWNPDATSSLDLIPIFVVPVVVQWPLTVYLMREPANGEGVAAMLSARGMFALFWLSIISRAAILLGLLLFLVPGVYLAALWSAATPFLIRDRAGPSTALRASWNATAGIAWPIALALVLVTVPPTIVIVGIEFASEWGFSPVTPAARYGLLAANSIAASLAEIAPWMLAVAVFLRVTRPAADLAEVFA